MAGRPPARCEACGGVPIVQIVADGPAIRRRCPACGQGRETPLTPSPSAASILTEVLDLRSRRARPTPALPVTVIWLPPGGADRREYRDTTLMIRERLVIDDPTVVLEQSPYPDSEDDPDVSLAALADFQLLAAPGVDACRAALQHVGASFSTRRAVVFGTGLAGEDVPRHPRLVALRAAEGEPGGLFDAFSGALAAIRTAAAHPLPDQSLREVDLVRAETRGTTRDDLNAWLLTLADRLGPPDLAGLLTAAGGDGELESRARGLLEFGALRETDDGLRVTFRGRGLLDNLLAAGPGEDTCSSTIARLFEEARQGNEEAFGRLLQMGGEEARRIAKRRLGSMLRGRVESVDIAQSVIADFIANLSNFEFQGEAPWKAYLRQLVENKIRAKADFYRAAKRDLRRDWSLTPEDRGGALAAPSEDTPPEDLVLKKEQYAKLEEALERMPDAERDVIMLRVFDGLSHREIARRLSRPSVNAVHQLYGRALARLTKLMGGAA